VFPAGEVNLDAAGLVTYLSHRNADEDDLAALFRQQVVWRTWLAEVAARGDAVGGNGALAQFLQGVEGGVVQVLDVPLEPVEALEDGGELRYELGPRAAELFGQAIPFPTGSRPGERIGVRVLDGTGEPARALEVASALVPHGAEILVIGNAARFGIGQTEVRYGMAGDAEAAALLADALGVGQTVLDPGLAGGSVAVTVIVGLDRA
jgi:hypothetical protein